jgi:predicted Co/Zn/Cd cation transporter (cation efflux family)
MNPSLFTLGVPFSGFQVWFVIYLYLLPLMLYTAWLSLSIMDLVESGRSSGNEVAIAIAALVPLVGAAWYLLTRATVLTRRARIAFVVLGAVAWLAPLGFAMALVLRPLGPKALS